MKNRFIGRVVSVGPVETLGKNPAKPFNKRVIVVDDSEPDSKYPNPVPFEATGDKCQYLDGYKVGDEVTIDFFLNGREWKDKQGVVRYFTSNRISYIQKGAVADAAEEAPDGGEVADAGGDPDDIPF